MFQLPMASYPYYSTSSSDISTPRSSSPASGRSSHTSISHKRMSISSRRMTDFNPMAGVNLAAAQERMKAVSLDQHRGYNQKTYGEVQQHRATEYVPESQAAAYQVLREPSWNRGMYRHLLLLLRLLPPGPTTPNKQEAHAPSVGRSLPSTSMHAR